MATSESKNTLGPPATSGEENVYSYWTDEDRSDKRGLRVSMSAAVAVHVLLLTLTFPQLYSEELPSDQEERTIFLVQTPRFKPPPPPPEKIPEKLLKKVPVPDPDPDKPEPFVADVAPTPKLDLDIDTGFVFGVPDEPPPMPETKDLYLAGGEVAPPERLHYVKPLYTEIARKTRTEGLVIVQAIINTEGEVIDLKVLKSVPMGLTEEALKAVRQWRYKPSAVDGRPVNVMLTVSVNFHLQ